MPAWLSRCAPRRRKPSLEVFEDRAVPAVFHALATVDDGAPAGRRNAILAIFSTVSSVIADNEPAEVLCVPGRGGDGEVEERVHAVGTGRR